MIRSYSKMKSLTHLHTHMHCRRSVDTGSKLCTYARTCIVFFITYIATCLPFLLPSFAYVNYSLSSFLLFFCCSFSSLKVVNIHTFLNQLLLFYIVAFFFSGVANDQKLEYVTRPTKSNN